MPREYGIGKSIAVVAVIVAGGALLAPWYGFGTRARAASPDDSMSRGVRSVAQAYALIERNFADPVSSEKVFYQGAIPGMLHTLDPHSNFVDPEDFREMQRRQRAQYFGVGMEIIMDEGKPTVARPMPGSPALQAGLRRGDIIMAVDGRSTAGLDLAGTAGMLRGPRGSQVRVTVRREGASDPLSFQVTRGEIQTSVVDAFWLQPGIAYLHIASFEAQNVSRDVETWLKKLGEKSVTGMVLDLRGNPGGLVNEAVAVAGRFLRNGQTVVSQTGRAEPQRVFRATAQASAQNYPIVVLVDRSSASASEIVSGALQDHDRAWILGENTFGKGLVQGVYTLSDGAALMLVIAHYYTPSGRLIQRDYRHKSFFDYYYAGRKDTQNPLDVKATDSGRKVYGGGGIAPDEKYDRTPMTPLQLRLLRAGAFFHFGSVYFGAEKPELPEGWQPEPATLDRFRAYLRQAGINSSDAEFTADQEWMRQQIRTELYLRAFDKETADRAAEQDDPEVKLAMSSLPKAQALLRESQRLLARREAARP
jgi:carboxyl-terminal processing protease